MAGLELNHGYQIREGETTALSLGRLRELLQMEPGIEVVAECANGPETLKTVQKKSPDIVFLDVRMPELDGFGVIQSLSARLLNRGCVRSRLWYTAPVRRLASSSHFWLNVCP